MAKKELQGVFVSSYLNFWDSAFLMALDKELDLACLHASNSEGSGEITTKMLDDSMIKARVHADRIRKFRNNSQKEATLNKPKAKPLEVDFEDSEDSE
jgi:hypothetical protein